MHHLLIKQTDIIIDVRGILSVSARTYSQAPARGFMFLRKIHLVLPHDESRSHETVHPSSWKPHGQDPLCESLRHNCISGFGSLCSERCHHSPAQIKHTYQFSDTALDTAATH